jgi:hypothetical protein
VGIYKSLTDKLMGNGEEAPQFHFCEYINRIFFAVGVKILYWPLLQPITESSLDIICKQGSVKV